MLLSLHPNTIVHVENVVSLFSSPSTSSQKVQKCGSHNFPSQRVLVMLGYLCRKQCIVPTSLGLVRMAVYYNTRQVCVHCSVSVSTCIYTYKRYSAHTTQHRSVVKVA